MTDHDADDAGAEGLDPEDVDDALEEIADEPADVDAALSDILDDGSDVVEVSDRIDPADVTVTDDLLAMVEGAPAENVARAIATLRAEVDALEAERDEHRERADDLESRLKRKQADFQNYKKRQKERLEEEKQRATEDLVRRLLDVRDNLQRALDQDEDVDIRGGVESTLEQFDQQFDRENVAPIEPEPGESTDPQRHEVLATVTSDHPEGTIASVHRPGYEMAGKVLRPAQVTVSDGSEHEPDEDGADHPDDGDDADHPDDGDDAESVDDGADDEQAADDQ